MNQQTNSIQAKLYRYFWCTDRMPQNLCPYFWKLIIMYVFIIPYAILSIPMYIFQYLSDESYRDDIPPIGMIFLGLAGYFAVSIVIAMVAMWFVLTKEGYNGIVMTGSLGWLIVIVYLGSQWAEHRKEIREEQIEEGTYEQNVFVSFAKAKYNKYCPKITWK